MENKAQKQYRCKYCGKLFFKGDLVKGVVEVKCKNCKNFNVFEGGEGELVHVSEGA
ncbi:MAG: hypothetical protein OEV93_01790 [Candidatus Moranbacteria bacterium]|nr:hypothetical protein [Candidatus Moranbacteria bacterium]